MNSQGRIQLLPIYTAALATILVIPSFIDPINLPKLWILCLGAGLTFSVYAFQIRSLWKLPNERSLLLVSLTFLGSLLISSILNQQDIFRTLIGVWGRNNGTLSYLALLIVFLSLASNRTTDASKFLIKTLGALGIFFALYGWMQSIGQDVLNWENTGSKIILTLGNVDFASALLAFTAIASLAIVLQPNLQIWVRAFFATSFLFQTYLIYESAALQGLIVLFFGSSVLVGLWLTFSQNTTLKMCAIGWWIILVLSGLLGILGLIGKGPLSDFLIQNSNSFKDRLYQWIAALNMMKDNLFLGVGIDSFGDYYRRYRTIEGVSLRSTAMSGTNNAHNVLMQFGATGGLVLLVPYLALLVFTGFRAVIALRTSQDKVLTSGMFSIWIAFQIQSMVSIDQIGLVVWGWASAGCLVSLSKIKSRESVLIDSKEKKPKFVPLRKQRPNALLVLLGLLPGIFLFPTVQNELNLKNQLVLLVGSENLETLKSNGVEVVKIASNSNEPGLRQVAIDYLLRAELTEDALKLSVKNTSDFPNSFESWNTTAEIFEKHGQKRKAIKFRIKSVELDPLNIEIKKLLEEDLASN